MAWDDVVLPFQLDGCDVRGRVARLDAVLEAVLRRHAYPAVVEALVVEMVLLTALIGQAVKLRWKLSLQVQSKGAVRMIATDYYAPDASGQPARVRACARFDAARLDAEAPPFAQLGEGYFAVLMDAGKGAPGYRGLTPLEGATLAACAESYFAHSEQLPTRVVLAHDGAMAKGGVLRWRAGGGMLQQMPAAQPGGDAAETWQCAAGWLGALRGGELLGPDPTLPDLLLRRFPQDAPRVFPAQRLRFGCPCSEARVRQSLSIYAPREIARMTTKEGRITADCQFCGAHYNLDPKTVGQAAQNP